MTEFTDHPPYKWKTVRVFISSTFRDFHAERDCLIKIYEDKDIWEEPGLLSECPKCGEGLKFNPFVVGGEE